MKTKTLLALTAVSALVAVSPAFAQLVTEPAAQLSLDPPGTMYDSHAPMMFPGNNVVITGLELVPQYPPSEPPVTVAPPPGTGTSDFPAQSFFDVFFDISINGGPSIPGSGTAQATETGSLASGGTMTETYNTEMTSLSLTGTDGSDSVAMNLESSPTGGGTDTVTGPPGGPFQISSFFDVFVELSLDGGAFAPQQNNGQGNSGATRLYLDPVPDTTSTLLLLVFAVALIAAMRLQLVYQPKKR